MSKTRSYTQISINIMLRFYEAVDTLILMKRIRGKQTYCTIAEIDKRKYYEQQKDINKGHFQVSWMIPLVLKFDVSSDWLLTGRGKMFIR